MQKQPTRGVLRKRCSENMQQIYRRTTMPKCDFSKVSWLWPIILNLSFMGISWCTVLEYGLCTSTEIKKMCQSYKTISNSVFLSLIEFFFINTSWLAHIKDGCPPTCWQVKPWRYFLFTYWTHYKPTVSTCQSCYMY